MASIIKAFPQMQSCLRNSVRPSFKHEEATLESATKLTLIKFLLTSLDRFWWIR